MPTDVATNVSPIVETATGKLRGSASGGIVAFKGVPYGASTAGANRFMPPRPPEPWAGVRDALAYRGHAPQLPGRPERRPELQTILGPADTTPEGEDCLTLNVWTPGLGDGARRPVMVWLHGGAFAYGSGNRAVTEGANLARRGDVVEVSPPFDPSGNTALVGATMMFEILCVLAPAVHRRKHRMQRL